MDSWDMIGFNLAKMREESYLCDFKIAASDFESTRTLIFAHSVVMAASCSKFYNSLVTNHTKLKSAQTFVTSEVSTSVLSIAVDFIYGTLPVDTDGIEALDKAAEKLGIPTAKKYIKSLEKKTRKVSKFSNLTKEVPKLQAKNIMTVKLLNSVDERNMKEMMRTSLRFTEVKCLENKVIHSCPICDMIYEEQLQFINHLNSCHKLKQCPLCFVQVHNSTSHFLKEHPVLKSLCYTQHDSHKEDPISTSSSWNEDNPKRKVIYYSNSFEDIEYSTRHCKLCKEEFTDISYLREHLVTNHHYVRCTYCHAAILHSRFLKHLKDLHNNSYMCCRCNEAYDTPMLLLEHINKKHVKKEVYFCSVCAFNTPVISNIIEHFVECHGILAHYTYLKGLNLVLTKFNLPRVPSIFNVVSGEENNVELKNNWLKTLFYCCCCSSCYNTIFDLCVCIQNHLWNKHPIFEEENPYNCWKCKKSFSDLPEYERHVHYHKINRSKYMCDICGYGTNLHLRAQTHANMHAGIKPYKCRFCERVFSDEFSMRSHVSTQHSNDTQTDCICQICGAKFKYPKTLKVHIRRLHSGTPALQCTLCSYKAHAKQCMIRHMKFHAGIKDIICSICSKGFGNVNALRKHMKRVHKVKYSTRPTTSQHQTLETLQ